MEASAEETLRGIDPYKGQIRVTCGSRKENERVKFHKTLGEVKAELMGLGMVINEKNTKQVQIVVVPDKVVNPGKTYGKRVIRYTKFVNFLRANPEKNEVKPITLPDEDEAPKIYDRDIASEASDIKGEKYDDDDIITRWTNELKKPLV